MTTQRRASLLQPSSDEEAKSGSGRSISISSEGEGSQQGSSGQVERGMWRGSFESLLTPQTVGEQAQERRRTRNREAARRSRQRQRERELGLEERQSELSRRIKNVEEELTEWRAINAAARAPSLQLLDPADVADEDDELARDINHLYAMAMDNLFVIGKLQIHLDEVKDDLDSMLGL